MICLLLLIGTAWGHDVWDLYEGVQGTGDDAFWITENVLSPNDPLQVHDLQAPSGYYDQDVFRIYPRQDRSYEVIGFNVTGDTGHVLIPSSTLLMYRYVPGPGDTIQSSARDPGGQTRMMRWISTVSREEMIFAENQYDASSNYSFYSIRLLDTTLFCPRFNNAGTQISVLLVQSTDPMPCVYKALFYDEAGTLLKSTSDTNINPVAVSVLALSSISELAGQKGSAKIAHTCGYGGVAAKLVALEPATGFSFDTPCSYLPRR